MRLLVFTQGSYGERVLDNIRRRAPRSWAIDKKPLPDALPQIVEDPGKVVSGLELNGEWDLVLFLGESSSAFSLLPTILKRISTSAVIAPVDDYSWLPLGLEQQIRSEMKDSGIAVVFPRTFCTLVPVGVPTIDEFAQIFGLPILRLGVEGGRVRYVEVLRGAPCGSTWYMAEKLDGVSVEEAGSRAATLALTSPCLASRGVERLFGDASIHVAGHLAKKAVEDAIKGLKKG